MNDTKGLTTESCKLMCHLVWKRTYFGTECGRECFCGDAIRKGFVKFPDSECNTPCAGDNNTTCGGFWRISVYKISGTECFCGDALKNGYAKHPDSECKEPCPGDKKAICGGSWRISIYRID
ncbi:uncharacterized protein [Haliotis asinina]|uniref:uncharacterized protein n=1 Tax=Haliotis asinina TaxID=109174 RepID=UPI0035319929